MRTLYLRELCPTCGARINAEIGICYCGYNPDAKNKPYRVAVTSSAVDQHANRSESTKLREFAAQQAKIRRDFLLQREKELRGPIIRKSDGRREEIAAMMSKRTSKK